MSTLREGCRATEWRYARFDLNTSSGLVTLTFPPNMKESSKFISSQSGHPTALRRLPRHTPNNVP